MHETDEKTYHLIDSGGGKKFERFGNVTFVRPCSQAVWAPKSLWKKMDAEFTREPENRWNIKKQLPESWKISLEGVNLKLSPTDFGHIGVFPEHAPMWKWAQKQVKKEKAPSVLNLFAYSGGMTCALAQAGAKVCHLDASKGMVNWARENALLNGLEDAPIRWIVDDVFRFLQREVKRERKYDAIILDPPTFGRGTRAEIFKIERDIGELLSLCKKVLSSTPLFILFSCHTPGFTPLVLKYLLEDHFKGIEGQYDAEEMTLPAISRPLPVGSYARWYR